MEFEAVVVSLAVAAGVSALVNEERLNAAAELSRDVARQAAQRFDIGNQKAIGRLARGKRGDRSFGRVEDGVNTV